MHTHTLTHTHTHTPTHTHTQTTHAQSRTHAHTQVEQVAASAWASALAAEQQLPCRDLYLPQLLQQSQHQQCGRSWLGGMALGEGDHTQQLQQRQHQQCSCSSCVAGGGAGSARRVLGEPGQSGAAPISPTSTDQSVFHLLRNRDSFQTSAASTPGCSMVSADRLLRNQQWLNTYHQHQLKQVKRGASVYVCVSVHLC